MPEKYRPANSSEAYAFHKKYCSNCIKHNPEDNDEALIDCEIKNKAEIFSIDEPEYPKQWVYGVNVWSERQKVEPICTRYCPNLWPG